MEPDFDEQDDDFEDDDDAINCGLTTMADGREICLLAGTEHCDWSCSYHDEAPQFRTRKRKIEPAPLLDLMERKP